MHECDDAFLFLNEHHETLLRLLWGRKKVQGYRKRVGVWCGVVGAVAANVVRVGTFEEGGRIYGLVRSAVGESMR